MHKRFFELDSLRGIAAFIVLIYHVAMLHAHFFNNTHGMEEHWLLNTFKYTPLRIFFAGSEAVILFFVLSGFVLSFPFYQGKKVNNSIFIVKRICRIYVPYIVAIGLALVAAISFSRGGSEGYETASMFLSPINLDLLIQHILMLGEYDSSALNPPIWSLIHEMRISLVFPLLMLVVIKLDWKNVLLFAIALTIVGYELQDVLPTKKFTISYSRSIHYMGMFVIGALMAKHINELSLFFKSRGKFFEISLILFSCVLVTFSWWFPYSLLGKRDFLIDQWATLIGVCIIIIASISFVSFSRILLKKPLLLLGKISYSLYLTHAIVMFLVIKVLGNTFSFFLTGSIIIISALITAYFFSFLIEEYSIRLGKYISLKMEDRRISKEVKIKKAV